MKHYRNNSGTFAVWYNDNTLNGTEYTICSGIPDFVRNDQNGRNENQ